MNVKSVLKIVSMIILLGVSKGGEIKDVIYENFLILGGEDIIQLDIDVNKIEPTKFLCNATLKLFKPFDDDWKVAFQISYKNKVDEEPTILHYPSPKGKGICEFLKQEYKTYFYETLKEYSNAPHYDTCPLQPTEYTATNYVFDVEVFKDYLSSGSYKIIMYMYSSEYAEENAVSALLKFSVLE